MSDVVFHKQAWEDYLYWQTQDKKTLDKINKLIREISRNPYEGTGHPEPLKYEWQGYWSRRIDKYNRLVYRIVEDNAKLIMMTNTQKTAAQA
jgi:toxin YoeB